MLDLVPIISYNYISASFEDLSLSKTINLNGTCTGKSKYGDPRENGAPQPAVAQFHARG